VAVGPGENLKHCELGTVHEADTHNEQVCIEVVGGGDDTLMVGGDMLMGLWLKVERVRKRDLEKYLENGEWECLTV